MSLGQNPAQTQLLLWTGALMKQDVLVSFPLGRPSPNSWPIQSVHKAIYPMLVKSGWPAETAEEWRRKAEEGMSLPFHLPYN
jgi:hypothetical protein